MRHCQAQEEFKFVWNGPTGEPIDQAFGKPAPVVFFMKANQIRREHKIYGPPFNPFAYADAMGVAVEEVAGMPIDGLLRRTESGRFVVQLKRDVCQSRKHFTLAHELAHTFFYDELMREDKFRGSRRADPVEEALCNIGARELLMPRSIFKPDLKKHLQNGLITPLTIFRLAERYAVSPQALAIRVATIEKGFACAVWKKSGHAINAHWAVPKSLGRLVLCQTGKSSIELAFRGPPNELISANDSFYCTGGKSRRIIRSTLSQKSPKGFVFSVMLSRGKLQSPPRGGGSQGEVSEHWWQRY